MCFGAAIRARLSSWSTRPRGLGDEISRVCGSIFFEPHGFAIYHPSGWRKGVLTGVVVKGHVVIPEEDVVNGEWVAVGPFDAFADFENCDFATVHISEMLGQVVLDAVWKGAFIAHEVFVEGFVGSRSFARCRQ